MGAGLELIRQQVVEATADLLAPEGRDAVTTRAVASAAGVQPPVIYRHLGDKDGLLEAVAEHGYATFLAAKHLDADPRDPVEDLRGMGPRPRDRARQPPLYALMYGEPKRGTTSAAFAAGMQILTRRIRRLAAGGWLRVEEELAAALIHATARDLALAPRR